MKSHFAELSAAGGRPEPKVDCWPEKSIRLNQSPESNELRSNDFDRSRSAPACQNDGP